MAPAITMADTARYMVWSPFMIAGFDSPSWIFVKPALQNADRLRNIEKMIRSCMSKPVSGGTVKYIATAPMASMLSVKAST